MSKHIFSTATDLPQFSDRMSGAFNEHSQKHEEQKLQLSRIARCVKDLHDRYQGPNPKDMQAQFMKLILRVNEINMQLTELRDRPPAASWAPKWWHRVGKDPGRSLGTQIPQSKDESLEILLLVFLALLTLRGLVSRLLLLGHLFRRRLPPSLAGIPLERGPLRGMQTLPLIIGPGVLIRNCGKSVCEDCFDHDCNSFF